MKPVRLLCYMFLHFQGASNINCSTVVFIIAAFYNQCPLITILVAYWEVVAHGGLTVIRNFALYGNETKLICFKKKLNK